MRLIWRFIVSKADIAVGPEDLRLAELGRELLEQFLHGPQHLLLVHGLAAGPVLLGGVILKPRVKSQRPRRPAIERHSTTLRWTERAACRGRQSRGFTAFREIMRYRPPVAVESTFSS